MAFMGGSVYGFYGGDVNDDGAVDGSDMAGVDNDNSVLAFGYNVSDVNGDGATDGSDMALVDNNLPFVFYFMHVLFRYVFVSGSYKL